MKKIIMMAVAAVLCLGSVAVYANCGTCPGDAAKKEGKCPAVADLKLTAEQQAKVEALKAECKKSGCSKEAKEKMAAGMKDILTADQFKQWQDHCAPKGGAKGCCPVSKK